MTSEFGNRSSLALYSNTRALFIRSYSNACDSSIQYRQREREREIEIGAIEYNFYFGELHVCLRGVGKD